MFIDARIMIKAIETFNLNSNIARSLYFDGSVCTYQTANVNQNFNLNYKTNKKPNEAWFFMTSLGANNITATVFFVSNSKGKFVQIVGSKSGKKNNENTADQDTNNKKTCLNAFASTNSKQVSGNAQIQGCFGGNEKCAQNLTSYCQQSHLFDMINNLLCPNIAPVECDVNIAPSIFGSNWMMTCGAWVNAKLILPEDRLDIRGLIGLCKVVSDSNAEYYARNPSRRYLQTSASSVTCDQDPTCNDATATFTVSETSSTNDDTVLSIDSSTTTNSNGYSDSQYNLIEANADANINITSGNSSSAKYLGISLIFVLLEFILI
jgi:hypothetical protein